MTKKTEIQEKLHSISWDFNCSSAKKGIHSIHPYPAKFIPEIPNALIEILPIPENTAILDPFSGSGTTLVEAQSRGFESIGVDSNPIACLMSRVKTNSLPYNFLDIASDCVEEAKVNASKTNVNIPNVDHWFKQEIQDALSSLIIEIDKVDNETIRDGLRLAVSSIIVRVSNQDSDTRYAAVEKKVVQEDVYKHFLNSCKKMSLHLSGDLFKSGIKSEIINKSILEVEPDDIKKPIGLVITSPPYPNAYEYWLYHKYRMFWLGYDPVIVKQQEIGARAHYFKKNHQTIEDFKQQMTKVLSLLNEVVVCSGYICFVVGRSIIHGEEHDNSEIIKEIAEKMGLTTIANIERTIAPSRKSFNLAHAKIKKENLLVFQKE